MAGFAIRPDRLPLEKYDRLAAAAGLELVERWATGTASLSPKAIRGVGSQRPPLRDDKHQIP